MLGNRRIGFIGGGNMAEALVKGLLAGGLAPERMSVGEPNAARREYLANAYGVSVVAENTAVVGVSEVVVLAVKPQLAKVVLSEIVGSNLPPQLLVSVMAGVGTSVIERVFAAPVRVVRVMPNTPALVLQAASAIAAGASALPEDVALVQELFDVVGKSWLVEERLMDAVTGLSGSGPAYVLTFVEALADAGVRNGLPRDVAMGLAIQTVAGTAQLLAESGDHPAVLRDRVTSPGGTTIAGLHRLEQGGFRAAVMDAVEAATARSRELG